jgi:hypothetical protein
MVDVPAQLVPGPALQSFWAFLEMPKHFSAFASWADAAWASVSPVNSAPATANAAAVFVNFVMIALQACRFRCQGVRPLDYYGVSGRVGQRLRVEFQIKPICESVF